MAIHGKLTKVFINGRHLSTEFDSANMNMTTDLADDSRFQMDDKAYTAGKQTATLGLEGFFGDTATAADKVLHDVLVAFGGVIWCIFPGGDTGGYGVVGFDNSHQVMSTKDDNARIAAACQSNIAERIVSILPLSTKTSSGSGTANNNGAASTDGAAYIQATAVTGSVAVKIEHSSDNSNWSDLVAFTAVAAIGAERKSITGEIKQYTKATYTLDGGESITCQVSLHRVPPPLAS